MNTFDFSRSYVRFRVDCNAQPAITVTHLPPTTVNNVRINIECRCELVDRRTGRAHVYVLGASCKTERVGADRDCWLEPNADFCLVASTDEFMMLKSWASREMRGTKHPQAIGVPTERQSGNNRDAWPEYSFQIRSSPGKTLASFEEVIAAIRGDFPIVARTEYVDGDWNVAIDYPVKTINYSERESVFQTDTGPILLPNLSAERLRGGRRLVECFDLAYSAFNSSGWVEFIVNVPTPIGNGMSVNHYSQVRRIEPVRNVLIKLQDENSLPSHHLNGELIRRANRAEITTR